VKRSRNKEEGALHDTQKRDTVFENLKRKNRAQGLVEEKPGGSDPPTILRRERPPSQEKSTLSSGEGGRKGACSPPPGRLRLGSRRGREEFKRKRKGPLTHRKRPEDEKKGLLGRRESPEKTLKKTKKNGDSSICNFGIVLSEAKQKKNSQTRGKFSPFTREKGGTYL